LVKNKIMKNNKTLIISDLHLSDTLPYDEYVEGGREKEKKEILDFIIEKSQDCDQVMILGDALNKKNNSSKVIREFTEFLERFENKKLYILGGNHTKKPDGTSAKDYLKEIKDKNWEIITNEIKTIREIDFCPYFSKSELGVKSNEEGQELIMSRLKGNKILAVHFAISDSLTGSGQNTNVFDEIVLPRKELMKRYNLVVAGHIHSPEHRDNVLITGSIFSREANEKQKFIWILDNETMKIEKIKLPGRHIVKLENPKLADLKKIPESSIVKVIITDPKLKEQVPEIKKELERFDGKILSESYSRKRKRIISTNENVINMEVEELLKIYSKTRKISLTKLISAWRIIKY